MRESDIRVGDVLQIRAWEDMAEEFGVTKYGDILPDIPFTPFFSAEMKKLCNQKFTVSEISSTEDFDTLEQEIK